MRSASKANQISQVTNTLENTQLGQQISLGQVFFVGDSVKVTGVSKGKGFQGGVRRHGFHGGPKTHGQKNRQRAPGSIGNTTPQRVLPGRRMAGHMGMERITSKNIKVVEINTEGKILFLNGAVPGYKGNKVEIYK